MANNFRGFPGRNAGGRIDSDMTLKKESTLLKTFYMVVQNKAEFVRILSVLFM